MDLGSYQCFDLNYRAIKRRYLAVLGQSIIKNAGIEPTTLVVRQPCLPLDHHNSLRCFNLDADGKMLVERFLFG